MENTPPSEPSGEILEQPPIEQLPSGDAELIRSQRRTILIIIGIALVFFVIVIASFALLMQAPNRTVAQLRDVFIIFLALESLLTGFVLVILMIQLSRLINLLNNEIKPILESTNDTVNNLRGTTTFLSESLVQPVIKMNEYLAGITKLLALTGIMRSTKKNKSKP